MGVLSRANNIELILFKRMIIARTNVLVANVYRVQALRTNLKTIDTLLKVLHNNKLKLPYGCNYVAIWRITVALFCIRLSITVDSVCHCAVIFISYKSYSVYR